MIERAFAGKSTTTARYLPEPARQWVARQNQMRSCVFGSVIKALYKLLMVIILRPNETTRKMVVYEVDLEDSSMHCLERELDSCTFCARDAKIRKDT